MMVRLLLLCCCLAFVGAAESPWAALAEASRKVASDPGAALNELEALVLEHPDFLPARFNLGTLLIDSDPGRAADHLEAATAYPGTALAADAWHNLALARWKQGKLEEAVAAASRAVDADGTHADYQKTFSELRRAWLVQQDELRRQREAEARKLKIPTQTLPEAQVGFVYAATIRAQGGTAPYRLTTADLPESVRLAEDGTLSGTPAAGTQGVKKVKITVADAAQATAEGTLTLIILPPPAITTTRLPTALVGHPYRADLTCEGLVRPRWRIDGLPPGLIATASAITGTPTQAGTFPLHIQVDDEAGRQAQVTLDLVVSDGVLPDPEVLPPATAWAPYEARLSVRGPPGTYTWDPVTQAGLSVDAQGFVSGSPEAAGPTPLALRIRAGDDLRWEGTVTVPVNPPPVIEIEDPLTLQRGRAINQALKVSGGTPPYSWSGSGGPTGVRVDSDGHLRGAPDLAGTSELVITVVDRWRSTSQVTITVNVEEPQEQQDQQDQEQQDQQEQPDQQNGQQPQDQQGQQDQSQQDQQQQGEPDQQQGQQQADQQGQQEQNQQEQAQESQEQQGDQGQQGQEPDQTNWDQPNQGEQQPRPESAQDQRSDQDQKGQTMDVGREAADRWLEHLEDEDRRALRLQLLPQQRPRQTTEPW